MVVLMKTDITSIKDALMLPSVEGNNKEMQLRMMLHSIRQAADEGESWVSIPLCKMSALHMPTLENEILKPAGFKTSEFKEETGVKKICISWQ